jgi:hypothetical protein
MTIQILRWTARILMIVAILFMLMFSFDVFEGDSSLGNKLLGFLMHNIPVLILAVILAIAWKKELWGGILIVLAAIAMMFYFHVFTGNWGALIILVPFLVAGILFIVCHYAGQKSAAGEIH